MKKAKIMLSVIAVLAIVGGALAFKANSKANTLICVPNLTPTICNVTQFALVIPGGTDSYYTGNKTQVKNCDAATLCNAQGRIISEGQ